MHWPRKNSYQQNINEKLQVALGLPNRYKYSAA